jgi:hypothetical protein
MRSLKHEFRDHVADHIYATLLYELDMAPDDCLPLRRYTIDSLYSTWCESHFPISQISPMGRYAQDIHRFFF